MNDQLAGQLGWTIPAYARDLLWLESESGAVPVEGAAGLFTLAAPASVLTLRWGGAAGPALKQLRWQVDLLGLGRERRAGRLHRLDAHHRDRGLPAPIVVLSVGGQPLKPGVKPYPDRAARRRRSLPGARLL